MAEGSGDDRVGSVFTPFYRFRSQLELSTSTNHHVKLSRFACALLVLIGSEHQQKCEKKKKRNLRWFAMQQTNKHTQSDDDVASCADRSLVH